jgi:hypothetical protein
MADILPPVPSQYTESSKDHLQSLPYELLSRMRADRDTIIVPTKKDVGLVRLLHWTFTPSNNVENLYHLRDVGYRSAERFVEERQKLERTLL